MSGADHFRSLDPESLRAILLPLRQALTSTALRQAQRDSLESMQSRLLELGWTPERLDVDIEVGCVWAIQDGSRRLVYVQHAVDEAIRQRFQSYRACLPDGLLIHDVPMNRVGALPTFELSALVGYPETAQDDFIAISAGAMKLGVWGRAVARAMGLRAADGAAGATGERPQAWWRSALLPLAYDLLGCTIDPGTLAHALVGTTDEASGVPEDMDIALEGFVFFHEMAHYELRHGDIHRRFAREGGVPAVEYYRMEAAADVFAFQAMDLIYPRNEIARTVCLLFLLLAMSPELLNQYPLCDNSPTYPHPVTRLIWLLRLVFPDDARKQTSYLNLMIATLLPVVAEATKRDVTSMDDAIRCIIMTRAGPPEPLFSS